MASSAAVRAGLVAMVGALALAGCVPTVPTPVPTQAATASSAPTDAAPVEPVLVEGGTAQENQAFFDKVNLAFASSGGSGSLGIAENLVAAGFRKQDMEVTADHTSIDLVADSIVVSVRLKGECLIGDFQTNSYKSIIAPLLGTGGCLIGTTVPLG